MKKIVFLIAIFMPMALFAQKSPVDKLFEKYANKRGFITVNISSTLLRFASNIDTGNDAASDMLSTLDGVRVLSVEDNQLNNNLDFYNELESEGFFKNNTYEVLMEVTEEDEIIRFLGRATNDGKFSELLLIVGGDSNALVSIRGLIDPENISKITRSLDIDLGSDLDFDF